MRKVILTSLVTVFSIFATASFAGTQEDRLAALEKKVKELESNKATCATKKGLDIKLYGFARLDAVWNDSNVHSGGGGGFFIKSRQETATYDNDDQFNMTARATRVGLDISGLSTETLKASGKIEFDFFGTGFSETNNSLRMRHAYVKLDMPESDLSILAGQTWDVVAPVLPPTIDQGVLWWNGNLGMRRTQLRITKGLGSVKLEGAIARNIGSGNNLNGIETGSDSGMPAFQGRVSFTTPIFNDLKSTIGISGHYGQEEFDTVAGSEDNDDLDSWSTALDLTVPLDAKTKITGEYYSGANCGSYAGCIGQTVNGSNEEIKANGGWVAISHAINEKLSIAGGYGLDDVDTDNLGDASANRNQTAFANVKLCPLSNVATGLELAHNKTDYMNSDDGDSLRVSMFMQYNF